MAKQNEDPRKKLDEPAEEQQLEQHNSVDEDSKETAQVIENDKLEEEKRKSEHDLHNSTDNKTGGQKKTILEDKDLTMVTNKDNDIVNKKGQ